MNEITLNEPVEQGEPDLCSFSVNDLIHACVSAAKLMGQSNPHRRLMLMSASALSQMAYRLSQYEPPDPVPETDRTPETPEVQ